VAGVGCELKIVRIMAKALAFVPITIRILPRFLPAGRQVFGSFFIMEKRTYNKYVRKIF